MLFQLLLQRQIRIKIIAPDVVARKYNLVPYPLEHIKIINSALIQQQKSYLLCR